jgi:CheY-like chemotaxis protein/two-component sensor histidine kinase
MSRIISGKIHLEVQTLQIQEVVKSAVESVRQAAEGKRIRLQCILDSSIGGVRGDPNRLQQVLWNLLTNAIKFTPNDGHVQVVLERVNSHLEVVVEDTGIGISADFLPYVFDRFRQADSSTTRRHGGLGLGLSIVRSLVELHGGSVRVKSPGENQGSTFIVALPIPHIHRDTQATDTGAQPASHPLDTMELPSLRGANILVVDDEADGRALIERILEGQGASVVALGSASRALEAMRSAQFDILLSDIGMPDMDGYEFVRAARGLDTGRPSPIPAIAITAYARPEDRQRSLLAGFNLHLAKPVEASELVASVAGLLHLTR